MCFDSLQTGYGFQTEALKSIQGTARTRFRFPTNGIRLSDDLMIDNLEKQSRFPFPTNGMGLGDILTPRSVRLWEAVVSIPYEREAAWRQYQLAAGFSVKMFPFPTNEIGLADGYV